MGSDDDGYAVRLRLRHYLRYAADPAHGASDDSPLYIFDGTFAERRGSRGMRRDYEARAGAWCLLAWHVVWVNIIIINISSDMPEGQGFSACRLASPALQQDCSAQAGSPVYAGSGCVAQVPEYFREDLMRGPAVWRRYPSISGRTSCGWRASGGGRRTGPASLASPSVRWWLLLGLTCCL